jgi:hypothetical protein
MNRRAMLKTVAVAGAASAIPLPLFGQSNGSARSLALRRYLESLARADGGYGWEGQEHSHLTPTFYVIGCYRVLKQTPPNKAKLAEFVRTHHPSALKKLEQERRVFEFQQVQALAWLGEDASGFREKVRAWTQPLAYLKQYEQHGYPVFQSELGAIRCRELLGLPLNDLTPHFTDYLNARRRTNGSFNNTPAVDGSDGHVMNTWWGLEALRVLNRTEEKKTALIEWLRACQLANGGFTLAPKPEFGGVDDVAYTWAAVRSLRQLGAAPVNRDKCISWLRSLANADGGFSDRPGWLSNPMATYYALDALSALDALDSATFSKQSVRRPSQTLPADLKVFTIQLEAHGRGSPAETVDLARSLRIHLWGAKNAKPEWIARAQAIANQQKVPVTFFVSDEEYGTWVNVPGLGTYSHTSDIIAPADSNIGASMANQGIVSWNEFRRRRLAPLEHAKGRLLWQFGENEELVRMFLDDSVERGGYAAISTFHFGNPDFTNSEPFLHRWRGQIPYVALQDAHGPEPWWFADMTTGFRTLFLASKPTWDGWLNAVKQNWVVPVRHDALSGFKTWMHSGSPEVLDLVRAHERNWRWWDNTEIQRPLVSIVVVKPEDEFEAARPERGVLLRVRCAWENTPQGLAKKPMTELLKLMVDGSEVSPTLVQKKQGAGFADYFHQFPWPDPPSGKHTAQAVARVIATNAEYSRSIEFAV